MSNTTCPQCKGKGLILIPGEFEYQCSAFSFRDRNHVEHLEKCPMRLGVGEVELRVCNVGAKYEIERLQSENVLLRELNSKYLADNADLLSEIKMLRGIIGGLT